MMVGHLEVPVLEPKRGVPSSLSRKVVHDLLTQEMQFKGLVFTDALAMKKTAYREYFESILENLNTYSDFDVYGHLDYVVRYGPDRNRFYTYEAYADIIDEILRKLISMGKGIEVNTAGFKYGLGHPNPTEAVLLRYHELGGEILTLGADAHVPEHVAYAFDRLPQILRHAGFRYFTVFTV